MARGLVTDYGMLMKAIAQDFRTSWSFPINQTKLLEVIRERYGEPAAKKAAVTPVYEYRLNLSGSLINFLYLIDIKADEDNKREVVIRDGVYEYDDYVISVINIDCGVFTKPDTNYEDVAKFFENFRVAISSFFTDTVLRPTDSIFISYFGAFAAIHSVFDVNKEGMLEIQKYMKPVNQVVTEDNKIYENMLNLYNARAINYLNICRAYEDGVNNVESYSVPVSKVVPSVQQGGN